MNFDNDEESLEFINRLLERLHLLENEKMRKSENEKSIVINIYKPGSQHVDRVENQYIGYPAPSPAPQRGGERGADVAFRVDTPLSALFRDNHHEELRKAIESWRPYLINDNPNVDALAVTRLEFDKDRIYSNKVYRDLCELDARGALQVSLSQLARYLAVHSNLSRSYATLYQQLKCYRSEYE